MVSNKGSNPDALFIDILEMKSAHPALITADFLFVTIRSCVNGVAFIYYSIDIGIEIGGKI